MEVELPTGKLDKQMLHRIFIEGLGADIAEHSAESETPLLVDLVPPFPLRIRLYLFNCTNPPGGRPIDEYKFQVILPGQKRGSRGSLDYSDGRLPVLAAYARITDEVKDGVFVMWDASKHKDFAYSANMQARTEAIIRALYEPVTLYTRSSGEIVLAARPDHLTEALKLRVSIMREEAEKIGI